jgi:hypothetical protein
MSGPIVRSGPSSQYSQNWDQVFAKKAKTQKTKAQKKSAAQPGKKRAPRKKKK